ncbi:hypothetical protein OHA21_03795 [Actinoplanes sp. NBC_00393]|uniref:hypothetical protein n=1 Tax=Actinoplanes sp. NBC_00393 TaxID=2975953 RepID=UPI002E23443E
MDAGAEGAGAAADPGVAGQPYPGRPTADNLAHWAGQLPGDEQRETRLRPGVTPPTPPPAGPPAREKGRWRRGPLLTLTGAALVAAVLIGLNMTASADQRNIQTVQQVSLPPAVTPQTGGNAAPASLPPTTELAIPPAGASASPQNLRVTLAGEVADDGGTLAVSIRDGKAIAYVCDGNRVEEWLQGTARGGVLSLKGKGGGKITGTFDARRAKGKITVEGDTKDFALGLVKKPSGLYRTAARVRGAQLNGSWIVLPNGRQVGVLTEDGVPAPAPSLDVTNRTTTVDGTTLTATTIDVDSGEGF